MIKKQTKTPVTKSEKTSDVVTDKDTKTSVDSLADCEMRNTMLVQQMKSLGFDTKKEGMTFREAMICSQIASAVKGDDKAYRNVMDYAKNEPLMPLEAFLKANNQ